MLDLVVVMRVAWIFDSRCCAAVLGTLRGDFCIALFVPIERIIRLFSMTSLFTLRTGYTLGDACVCDGVRVVVGDLVSTNLSNSYSLCLPLLLLTPFNTAIQSAISCITLLVWVIVGLVKRL